MMIIILGMQYVWDAHSAFIHLHVMSLSIAIPFFTTDLRFLKLPKPKVFLVFQLLSYLGGFFPRPRSSFRASTSTCYHGAPSCEIYIHNWDTRRAALDWQLIVLVVSFGIVW